MDKRLVTAHRDCGFWYAVLLTPFVALAEIRYKLADIRRANDGSLVKAALEEAKYAVCGLTACLAIFATVLLFSVKQQTITVVVRTPPAEQTTPLWYSSDPSRVHVSGDQTVVLNGITYYAGGNPTITRVSPGPASVCGVWDKESNVSTCRLFE